MKRPWIGVVPLWDEKKESIWMLPGYMDGIEEEGGIPVILPLSTDPDNLRAAAEKIDGLLMTGGHDVSPSLYQEEQDGRCHETCAVRDKMEQILFAEMIRQKKPVLGICRGIQLMNVLLGGNLYQDIPSEQQFAGSTIHQQKPPYDQPVHPVKIIENTPLDEILGQREIVVNSYHHQAVKDLGEGLAAAAVSPDGIVEGVYMPEQDFVLGVQWHPEFIYKKDEKQRKLFAAFVKACR